MPWLLFVAVFTGTLLVGRAGLSLRLAGPEGGFDAVGLGATGALVFEARGVARGPDGILPDGELALRGPLGAVKLVWTAIG
jgi:hypothetical protein